MAELPEKFGKYHVLGVVLFELLTGRAPFTSPRLSRLLHQVVNDPAPSVLDIRPDLPGGLDSIDRLAHSSGDERVALGVEAASRPVAPNLPRQAMAQPLIQAER